MVAGPYNGSGLAIQALWRMFVTCGDVLGGGKNKGSVIFPW